MSPSAARAQFFEALEFFGYFLVTGALCGAMYWLMQYRPHADAKWYIMASAGTAIVSIGYALRMYFLFRSAFRRRIRPIGAPDAQAHAAVVAEGVRLSWSERIAAEREGPAHAEAAATPVVLPYIEDMDDGEDEETDPALALDAIKARIAERMQREDAENEEARRRIEKFGTHH